MTACTTTADILVLRATLTFDSAWHVGGDAAEGDSVRHALRGSDGSLEVPGTAIASLFSRTIEGLAPFHVENAACHVRSLFGHAKDRGGGAPSRLSAAAARLDGLESLVRNRDHVGIHRGRRSAQGRLLFRIEVAPKKAAIVTELSVESASEVDVRLLHLAVLHLTELGGHLGAGSSRGLGWVRMTEAKWGVIDVRTRDGLSAWLLGTPVVSWTDDPPESAGPPRSGSPTSEEVRACLRVGAGAESREPGESIGPVKPLPDEWMPQVLLLDARLTATREFLVRGGTRTENDHEVAQPVTEPVFGGSAPDSLALPGSGSKGACRSYAERILRQLAGRPDRGACSPVLQEGDSVCMPACGSSERAQSWSGMSALEVYERSCPACRMFGSALMRSRLSIRDGDAGSAIRGTQATRVAVPRFQGGSARRRLFTTEPGTGAVDVRVRLDRFEPWMAVLTLLLLRDLGEGRFGLGSGFTRGMGRWTCTVTSARLLVLRGTAMHEDLRRRGVTFDGSTLPPYVEPRGSGLAGLVHHVVGGAPVPDAGWAEWAKSALEELDKVSKWEAGR